MLSNLSEDVAECYRHALSARSLLGSLQTKEIGSSS